MLRAPRSRLRLAHACVTGTCCRRPQAVRADATAGAKFAWCGNRRRREALCRPRGTEIELPDAVRHDRTSIALVRQRVAPELLAKRDRHGVLRSCGRLSAAANSTAFAEAVQPACRGDKRAMLIASSRRVAWGTRLGRRACCLIVRVPTRTRRRRAHTPRRGWRAPRRVHVVTCRAGLIHVNDEMIAVLPTENFTAALMTASAIGIEAV